jgi:hypothetical protein
VHQAGRDVPVLDGEVVVWPKDVGWHNGEVVAAVLLVVATAEDLDHSFCVGISLVRWMGRALVKLILGNGVFDLIRKNAGRCHAHDSIYAKSIGAVEHIIVDGHVFHHHFNLRFALIILFQENE